MCPICEILTSKVLSVEFSNFRLVGTEEELATANTRSVSNLPGARLVSSLVIGTPITPNPGQPSSVFEFHYWSVADQIEDVAGLKLTGMDLKGLLALLARRFKP